jgi:hypothetical protein
MGGPMPVAALKSLKLVFADIRVTRVIRFLHQDSLRGNY